MPLYFAYGSNMALADMAVRCPQSSAQGLARLPRHRFGVTQRGYATVRRDARTDVWGVLWTLAFADVPALDRWEEISRRLYRKTTCSVVRAGGAAVRSLIYLADLDEPGSRAPRSYGKGIVHAAEAAGAPAPYVRQLRDAFGLRDGGASPRS